MFCSIYICSHHFHHQAWPTHHCSDQRQLSTGRSMISLLLIFDWFYILRLRFIRQQTSLLDYWTLRSAEMYTTASGGFTSNRTFEKTCPSDVFEIVKIFYNAASSRFVKMSLYCDFGTNRYWNFYFPLTIKYCWVCS